MKMRKFPQRLMNMGLMSGGKPEKIAVITSTVNDNVMSFI